LRNKKALLLSIVLIFSIGLISTVGAMSGYSTGKLAAVFMPGSTGEEPTPETSSRVIVMLKSPPLVKNTDLIKKTSSMRYKLDTRSALSATYISALKAEQNTVMNNIKNVLSNASISTFANETGKKIENRYTHIFNGMAIDVGTSDINDAMRKLRKIPGVKNVYKDLPHYPTMYASLPLINAESLWNNPAVNGMENAGAGIKVASMDGGIHHDAPMFDGTGFQYPGDFPAGGLGVTENNNGKIIASRAYFRPDDPPAEGDENVWPGEHGISHGVHTSGSIAGNAVSADYAGLENIDISGVAPGAWVMSYRVFYAAESGNKSFFTAEGISALEDIVEDGADVLNNSWGSGPVSPGGEVDPIDMALLNAARAGIFVSMSTGNSGPGKGTVDHPSNEYISVAATTTDGTLAAGRLTTPDTESAPAPPELQDVAFGTADFGESLPLGVNIQYELITAESIDSANIEGCNPWSGTPFEGKAVVISRGSCDFVDKVYYAQEAGAVFVIIYNNQGDSILDMGCNSGPFCDEGVITIPSIFVGQSVGEALEDWYDSHNNATVELNTTAFQAGNEPDIIIDFSSRGPAVGNVLKPDIAAPGVNILSQGYTPGAIGEARHLGYGQVSGTSMAAPHIAGAAALLRQVYPEWSNADIKSALMSTSKFIGIYNQDNTPAQPLDMGAGRVDLGAAVDPGVILGPPSLSYGLVKSGEEKSLTVQITNITDQDETYTIGTLYTGDGFDNLRPLDGFSVQPERLTVPAGRIAEFTVKFSSNTGMGIGDNQGYIALEGNNGHTVHLPAWARVIETAEAEILIIDNDMSALLGPENGFPDYLSYYTDALDELGMSYAIWDADEHLDNPATIPDAAHLLGHKAVIYFSGNNYFPDGSFTSSTPLTGLDMDRLTEYANSGGILIAMGQDLAYITEYSYDVSGDSPFFYADILGGRMLQDSVSPAGTDGEPRLPELPIAPMPIAPLSFKGVSLDLSGNPAGDGAGNQMYIDELGAEPNIDLSYENEELLPSYTPILQYNGPDNIEQGIVTMLHRNNPSLEQTNLIFIGRTAYASFGLEGINNLEGHTSRAGLLKHFLNWAYDEPAGSIAKVSADDTGNTITFEASLSSNIAGTTAVSYRWDFGDGSGITELSESNTITHQFPTAGTYNVRVEITDSWGNSAIAGISSTAGPLSGYGENTTGEPSGRSGAGSSACFISSLF
jgi:subtilisin family serine protease